MERTFGMTPARVTVGPVRATTAALCANLVGIGIARFGYTPLLPAIIATGWFAPSAAAYLGAANLAGYVFGALGARSTAAHFGAITILRSAMLLTSVSLFACAFPINTGWFFIWRFVSGTTGGLLMALAAPTAMVAIRAGRRGVAGGAIFAGVGFGIVASGTLVPLLIGWGLFETWIGLGTTALMLTVLSWNGWPATSTVNPTLVPAPRLKGSGAALRAFYFEYALIAVGLVPHMLFLVDYVARNLGWGIQAGSFCWIVLGAGALGGPLIAGRVADRAGFRVTLRWGILILAVAVAAPLLTTGRPILLVSTFIVGAFVPTAALAIGCTHELTHNDPARQAKAWSYCVAIFAIGQAVAGYVFSYIFSDIENPYPILFASASAALILALLVDVAVNVISCMQDG